MGIFGKAFDFNKDGQESIFEKAAAISIFEDMMEGEDDDYEEEDEDEDDMDDEDDGNNDDYGYHDISIV